MGYVLLIFCSLLIPLLIHIVSFYWHFVLLVNKQGETIHKTAVIVLDLCDICRFMKNTHFLDLAKY